MTLRKDLVLGRSKQLLETVFLLKPDLILFHSEGEEHTLEVLMSVKKPILGSSSSSGCLILRAGDPTGEVGGPEGSFPRSICFVQGTCSARESRCEGGALLPMMHLLLGVPPACLQPPGWPRGSWSPAEPRGEGVRAAAPRCWGRRWQWPPRASFL